jgi:hypothetical protein
VKRPDERLELLVRRRLAERPPGVDPDDAENAIRELGGRLGDHFPTHRVADEHETPQLQPVDDHGEIAAEGGIVHASRSVPDSP